MGLLQAALGRAGPTASFVGASIRWYQLLRSLPQVPSILADFGLAREPAAPSQPPPQSAEDSNGDGLADHVLAGLTAAAAGASEHSAAAGPPLLEQVARVASSLLGREVEPDQPLMEAGLDSLGAHSWPGLAILRVFNSACCSPSHTPF